ncbi:unnamed protein product [Debaryomyces tyrocola]|nr:unnamed protein product [Debaryomyces tyrocola]
MMNRDESGAEFQAIAANASLEGTVARKNQPKTNMEKATPIRAATANGNSTKQLMRDISFKPRFRYNYGFDEKFYDHALKYKDAWQDRLFYVDEDAMIDEFRTGDLKIKQFPTIDTNSLKMSDMKLKKLSEAEISSQFGLNKDSLQLSIARDKTKKETKLQFGESIDLNEPLKRNGLALNTGGHVTSMSWLPQKFNENGARYQYLAVSVINNANGLKDTINNPQLSVFHNSAGKESNNVKSGIQIWQYDLTENKFELYKFLITTSIGVCSRLTWTPIYIDGSTDILGILCGTFTDGKLHLLKIKQNTKDTPDLSKLIKSSLHYELKDPRGNKDEDTVGITCFDFLNHEKIIVGLSVGSIAEFILPYYTSEIDEITEENDINQPSFVQTISETPLTSISIANPDELSYFILINTSGSQSFALEYGNFQQGRIESYPTNTLLKPIYNHSLKVFLLSDAWDSIGYNFVRHPQEKPSSVLKLDGVVSSFHSSEVTGHPLNISGTTFGEIHIVNISRKILNGAKATNKLLIPLKLWKLQLNSDNKTLELSGDYEIVQTDKSTKISVTPPDVIISSLAWNENLNGSSIYTAATVSGLLILERLDPKYNNK